MFSIIKRLFIWWLDCTIGTWLHTVLRGTRVGEDEQGNTYYRSKKGDRRWVIYNGDIEASRVPPEWHAWLHHIAALPPSESAPERKPWEKDHLANRSGTAAAYAPPGSLRRGGTRSHATGDYEAWTPDSTAER